MGRRLSTCAGWVIGVAMCLVTTLSACARPKVPVVTPVNPEVVARERLAATNELLRAGCLDCLFEAFRAYQALREVPAVTADATSGVIRAAALIALRERELGTIDDGYLKIARDLMKGGAAVAAWPPELMDIIELRSASGWGIPDPDTLANDESAVRLRVVRQNRAAWTARLRESAALDEVSAYTWLSFMCSSFEDRETSLEALLAPVAPFRDTPLIAYKEANCRQADAAKLEALRTREPRFVETAYHLGVAALSGKRTGSTLTLGEQQLDEADTLLQEAYDWHPQWPSLTLLLASIALTVEDFERALEFYDKTLAFGVRQMDAMIGKVRALTYLTRHTEAIAVTDRLLAQRWYLGDAYYWRALNEAQLMQYDAAWLDIEASAKLLINADVPKLAGIIAYRRQQLDVARTKFELARERARGDCETGFYLGAVLAELRVWARTADVLVDTCGCLEGNEQRLAREIEQLRTSEEPAARKARKIARREQQIANGRRLLATSWFNIAAASFNLSRPADARQYAEKLTGDQQFGDRARELLARLDK